MATLSPFITGELRDKPRHGIGANINRTDRPTMAIVDPLAKKLIKQLKTSFDVTIVNGNKYTVEKELFGLPTADFCLCDCRDQNVNMLSFTGVEHFSGTVLFLINAQSTIPHDFGDFSNPFELVSEEDILSNLISLKCKARRKQHLSTKQTPGKRLPSDMDKLIAENALTILQTVMQYSTDWMVVKDLDHRFLLASEKFCETTQKNKQDIIGKNDLEIGTPEELVLGDQAGNLRGFWNEDNAVTDNGQATAHEHIIIQETSLEQLREHVDRVPLKDANGTVFGLFVCVKQAYHSTINGKTVSSLSSRRTSEMQPIVKRLKDDRNRAELLNRRSQTAFKSKNNFIATASHDLRQPLHAIGLFIESLERQLENQQQRDTLAKMKKSSQHLNNLLNSILDISKLDAGAVPVTKSHFNILQLFKSIEDEFSAAAQEKSLVLHVGKTDTIVHTDSLLLSRILKNLVSNAVKYSNTGSVNIITEIENNTLAIRVKDTGPGIPEEQYQAIFNEYHQINNQNNLPNFGLGLGLSIVKRLVELLELDLQLHSCIGEGSEFKIKVPLGNDKLLNPTTEDEYEITDLKAHKLLVIEDDPVVLEAMNEMLQSLNCDVYPAFNIDEAVEIINELEELPDAMIVDYQLANGVTGNIAIDSVCSAAGKQIPAIIVTGNTHSSIVRKASESAYRVLNKPVNPDTLMNTVNSAIENQEISNHSQTTH